jgi:hypothetical protein
MSRPRDDGEQENEPLPIKLTISRASTRLESITSKISPSNWRKGDGTEGDGHFRKRASRMAGQERHIRIAEEFGNEQLPTSGSGIYLGSYRHSPHHSRVSISGGSRTPQGVSPRASMSHVHMENLLQNMNYDVDTYGLQEFRDGFFDAMFLKPKEDEDEDLMRVAEYTLPLALRKRHPLSVAGFLPKQWEGIKDVCYRIFLTRAGIKLLKSFLGFFVAYILCLITPTGNWLGQYRYILPLSAIINHSGRTIGAQLDGAFLTTLGTALGLGWGALALYVSDSSSTAIAGYGGILAAFLIIFIGTMAAIRSYFIRCYQLSLTAGIAIIFTCLAETSRTVTWSKFWDYGLPWVFGQAICLIVCCTVFPDAGARPLAVALHDAFEVMQDSLEVPRRDELLTHRRLSLTFVNLSQAYRDLGLDISITRFLPSDVKDLRNLMQAVVRSLMALKTETDPFEGSRQRDRPSSSSNESDGLVINIDGRPHEPALERVPTVHAAMVLVADALAEPTDELLSCIRKGLATCDAVLLGQSGYRRYLGPPDSVGTDVADVLTKLRKAMLTFDKKDDNLMESPNMPPTYSDHPEIVKMFLFMHPVRQTASCTEALLVKVMAMKQRQRGWRLYLPSYPLLKGLNRTNAQVRHDRGGVTAGQFFRTQGQLDRMMNDLQKSTYTPTPRFKENDGNKSSEDIYKEEEDVVMDRATAGRTTFRYHLWQVVHRLQGFETRFALKVIVVTTLLSVPAWLDQSVGWYNDYQSWWAVILAWLMMHPRVGGNIQDLITRSLCGVLGAVWGGLSYAAGDGNPYVIAVFAAIWMIPMMYRFTQSTHPRSGVVGCISFTVVSLTEYRYHGELSVAIVAVTHGVAFVVGITSAVVVNWILWPFVARHELRKSISAMIFHSAVIYRGVVANYIYYDEGQEPGKEEIAQSELLEGRLREGFVRMRQLLVRKIFKWPLLYSNPYTGIDSSRNTLTWPFRSKTILSPDRVLRVLLRTLGRGATSITILPA